MTFSYDKDYYNGDGITLSASTSTPYITNSTLFDIVDSNNATNTVLLNGAVQSLPFTISAYGLNEIIVKNCYGFKKFDIITQYENPVAFSFLSSDTVTCGALNYNLCFNSVLPKTLFNIYGIGCLVNGLTELYKQYTTPSGCELIKVKPLSGDFSVKIDVETVLKDTEADFYNNSKLGVVSSELLFRIASIADCGVAAPIVNVRMQDFYNAASQRNPNVYVLAGDIDYNATKSLANYAYSLGPISALLSTGTVLMVPGNHDIGNVTEYNNWVSLFGPTYFNKKFLNNDISIYCLNSDIRSSGVVNDIDGSFVGGTQYKWLLSSLQRDTSEYKILVKHHPHTGYYIIGQPLPYYGNDIFPFVDWDFSKLGFDLELFGHVHQSSIFIKDNVLFSSAAYTTQGAGTATGVFPGVDPIYRNSANRMWAEIDVYNNKTVISYRRITSSSALSGVVQYQHTHYRSPDTCYNVEPSGGIKLSNNMKGLNNIVDDTIGDKFIYHSK